jgi:hypothetical protein
MAEICNESRYALCSNTTTTEAKLAELWKTSQDRLWCSITKIILRSIQSSELIT